MAAVSARQGTGIEGKRKRRSLDRAGGMPYWLIVPGLAFYLAFVIVPIIATVRLSFYQWDGLGPEVGVGWGNFTSLLSSSSQTWSAFEVSGVMVIFTCLLPVGGGLLLVGFVARTKVRGLSFLRFVFFLPYTVALAAVAIGWRWIYASNGVLNGVVGATIGKSAEVAYLGSFSLALPAVGIIAFWATFGFVTVLLFSGAQHIPREQFEAARIDGAGPIREFLAVTLPGLRHELRVVLVMTFIMAMRTFDIPFVTTQGGPGYTTTTPILTMYQDVFQNGEIGQGAAIAVIVTLFTVAGVLIITWLVRTGD
jgi:raffinose/stachyose/melibiose transport system permease protein